MENKFTKFGLKGNTCLPPRATNAHLEGLDKFWPTHVPAVVMQAGSMRDSYTQRVDSMRPLQRLGSISARRKRLGFK